MSIFQFRAPFHAPLLYAYLLLLVASGTACAQFNNGLLVELYNDKLNHYFYTTAGSGEAEQILKGSAGAGWQRTGWEFGTGNVLMMVGYGAPCRFYGSQSPGPNSHFYSMNRDECNVLKQLQIATPATERRWNFEGDLPVVLWQYKKEFDIEGQLGKGCLIRGGGDPGYVRLLRFYNNGFARGFDSNHRFVYENDLQEIARMLSQRWVNEGIALCALKAYKDGVVQP